MKPFYPLIALLMIISAANSAGAASLTSHASAEIMEALIVASRTPLNFGYITPSTSGGTVIITPQNIRSATGGVQVSGAFSRATFVVQGSANRSYSISTPSSVNFTVSNPASGSEGLRQQLTANQFVTFSTNKGSNGNVGQLGSNGQDTIYLGGTLDVPPDAAPGVYSGLVELTVSY